MSAWILGVHLLTAHSVQGYETLTPGLYARGMSSRARCDLMGGGFYMERKMDKSTKDTLIWSAKMVATLIAVGFLVSFIADAIVKGQEIRAKADFCRNAKANKLPVPDCK